MTEAEWLGFTDPRPMLLYLGGRASDRKMRLFACACCRRIWPLLADAHTRRLVELIELDADGLAPAGELEAARAAAGQMTASSTWDYLTGAPPGALVNGVLLGGDAVTMAIGVTWWARAGVNEAGPKGSGKKPLRGDEGAHQCSLLRDLFANPFRPVFMDSPLPMPGVADLAKAIYDDRAFERLPILADALEEAGCSGVEILMHCRTPGDHARGCWAVDAVLGRE